MMRGEAYARAVILAGNPDEKQLARLEILCEAAVTALEAGLREDIRPEDCRETFAMAAAMEAVAALEELGTVSEFKAGDLTVKKTGGDHGAQALRQKAQLLMGPYVKDRFQFAGV